MGSPQLAGPPIVRAPRTRSLPWYVANARVRSRPHWRVKLLDILTFFRQLSTLIKGGNPIMESVQIAGNESESILLRKRMEQVAARIAGGQSFHAAAGTAPDVFNEYWIQLIRTGEASGNLPAVLERLVVHLEISQNTRAKVLASMTYPCVLVFVSLVGLFVMLWKVVPSFTIFFKDFGGSLPGITLLVIWLSDFVLAYAPFIIGTVAAAIYLIRRYLKSDWGWRQFTNTLLVLPLLGDLMVQTAMQRFASNLALLLKSGTPLLEALEIMESLFVDFPAYRDAFNRTYLAVSRGADMASSVEGTELFTPLLCSMVRVGEETGELVQVLDQLEIYYRQRVTSLLERVTGLIEPVTIIFMGVVVGGLLTAIYIPLFKMSSGSRV